LLLDPAKLLGDEEAALVGHLNNEDESEEGEE
jgi:purine-binding chemotaxis protein CheW